MPLVLRQLMNVQLIISLSFFLLCYFPKNQKSKEVFALFDFSRVCVRVCGAFTETKQEHRKNDVCCVYVCGLWCTRTTFSTVS